MVNVVEIGIGDLSSKPERGILFQLHANELGNLGNAEYISSKRAD